MPARMEELELELDSSCRQCWAVSPALLVASSHSAAPTQVRNWKQSDIFTQSDAALQLAWAGEEGLRVDPDTGQSCRTGALCLLGWLDVLV